MKAKRPGRPSTRAILQTKYPESRSGAATSQDSCGILPSDTGFSATPDLPQVIPDGLPELVTDLRTVQARRMAWEAKGGLPACPVRWGP